MALKGGKGKPASPAKKTGGTLAEAARAAGGGKVLRTPPPSDAKVLRTPPPTDYAGPKVLASPMQDYTEPAGQMAALQSLASRAAGLGGGGGYSTPAVYTPPPPVPPALVPPTVAPSAAPQITASAAPSAQNVAANAFSTSGGPSTFGQFQRQRLNRGPRTGPSITPELLRRLAAQRISRQ